MKTAQEVVSMLRHELKTAFDSGSDTDPIGNIRMRQLLLMEDCLNAIGFPTHEEHKAKVSLVPYIFQEANYDDISWTAKNGELEHLSAYFELDFMMQNQGKSRQEATEDEFSKYVEDSFNFIDQAQKEK